jgi:PAS domain S-box-containing protein
MKRAERVPAGRRKARKRHPDELFAAVGGAHLASEEHVRTLLHELQVHAEEITAQNEQLRKTQAELEQARARYVDLYDFAPIGYLTLNKTGVIVDVNHAGAALLGFDREFVQNLPLTAAVQPSQRMRLRQFLAECWSRPLGPTATIELRTKATVFKLLRFTCRVQGAGRAARLFTALVDVTEERRLELERAEALERVKALIEQLVTVQEAERRRIALNLHDHIGQQLTALRLTLGTMRDAHPTPAQDHQLDTLDTLTAQMDRDLDYLAWELRPAALDDVGLEAALQQFVTTWSAQHRIPAEFHTSKGDRLPGATESNLYRITQEALNNVIKHAGATRVSVILERRVDEAILIVEDNGRGFDFEKARAARSRHAGMGLVGMEERAALIGATIQFESAPGKGSTLFVKIPVTRPAQPRS